MTDLLTGVTAGDLHTLLLRSADRLPGDVLAAARRALAEHGVAAAARAIAAAALQRGLALSAADCGLLVEATGEPPVADLLQPVVSDDEPVRPAYGFSPALTDDVFSLNDQPMPQVLDLTGVHGRLWASVTNQADHAAVAAMARLATPVALWRAWRWPGRDIEGAPAPVFIVESSGPSDDDLPSTTATVQAALEAADLANPLVEVYHRDTDLPAYQRFARGHGALLWAAEPATEIRTARVFDRVSADGPRFDSDHPLLDDTEREHVVEYLAAGLPLLVTSERMADIVEPERGAAVPMSFRTDGRWIWTDAVTYYADVHGLVPDADLLSHLRAQPHRRPVVDAVAEHRALATLLTPAADEPVWRPGHGALLDNARPARR